MSYEPCLQRYPGNQVCEGFVPVRPTLNDTGSAGPAARLTLQPKTGLCELVTPTTI